MSIELATETAGGPGDTSPVPVRHRSHAVARLLRRPGAVLCLSWVVLVFVASCVFRLLDLGRPLEQKLIDSYQSPSGDHLLGTDMLGRDVLARLLYGGWETLAGAAVAVAIAIVLGTVLGLAAGYVGRAVDTVVNWLQDILITLPTILVLLAVATVLGNNVWAAMIVLGVLMSATFIRLVRASTLAVREELYVDAAKVAGLSTARILARHVLPNAMAPVLIQGSAALGAALVVQAGLGFLGLGAPPPVPSWGGMIAEAANAMSIQPWLLVPSGGMIILTVLALNLLGDYLRDELYASRTTSPEHARRRPARGPQQAPVGVPEAGPDALVAVRDLTVSFPVGDRLVPVVSGISFTVRRGEVVGLVGESGCGKTMTGLSLIGLVPEPGVVTGRMQVAGHAVDAGPRSFRGLRGTRIALISQEPMVALDPSFTVGSLLTEALRSHGRNRADARTRARELLELVGIPRIEDVLRSYPHQLSGGMAQRVAIALAISGDPELLIADEPTTALDVTVQAEILDLLRDLQQRLGMGLLLITHDLGVVADICTRVIVMYAGEIVEEAPVGQLFDQPRMPYTRALMASTPVLDVVQELHGIPGTVPLPAAWPDHCRFAARCDLVVDRCRSGPVPLEPVAVGHEVRCVRSAELALTPATVSLETPAVRRQPVGGR
ncbi:dipeptide/oligopeptide/nickel ABC transporter permease/ATP-binding protein [Modestobacter sp. VKM Ac-2986]|uniref:dipeptide/oligopeptide/nickel ABC transporter permease/ATP-binding protein n=1 Tax=Modestobacter sp. VKM Ac-2986 TaxID=3004140 RepID=UPI0022AB227A|nr:dipeptide/oligopeptide/nickel ABC transporter permease/ATP-binding protein [Modestobacter sp. VKM Ac-2986]MCZ2827727.1 dipeptide/oligopeptide/nickel ABC transporter permease/ATP-binding protein [Modestobacter sp. VKM Ac-2986]